MTWISRLAASGAVLVAFSQPSWAVMTANTGAPTATPPPVVLQPVIERGGTINKVDLKKGTLVVDGVEFVLSDKSVIVHAAPGRANGKITDLIPKMKIRFNTSKYNSQGPDRITEIWVASNGGAPGSPPEKSQKK